MTIGVVQAGGGGLRATKDLRIPGVALVALKDIQTQIDAPVAFQGNRIRIAVLPATTDGQTEIDALLAIKGELIEIDGLVTIEDLRIRTAVISAVAAVSSGEIAGNQLGE